MNDLDATLAVKFLAAPQWTPSGVDPIDVPTDYNRPLTGERALSAQQKEAAT